MGIDAPVEVSRHRQDMGGGMIPTSDRILCKRVTSDGSHGNLFSLLAPL